MQASSSLSEIPLARAVLYRGLRLGLQSPASDLASAFSGDEARAALSAAARTLDGCDGGPIESAMNDLCDLCPVDPAALEEEYDALFGHTLRGLVCPYEGEYGLQAGLQQSQHLADLGGFYKAFGLQLGRHVGERFDHVACELEFLEFLSQKEAWALDAGKDEMAEVTVNAARGFLRNHLGRFGRAFARNLARASVSNFYTRLATNCDVFLESECTRFGIPVGLAVLELRTSQPDETPMVCDLAGCEGPDPDQDLVQLGDPDFREQHRGRFPHPE